MSFTSSLPCSQRWIVSRQAGARHFIWKKPHTGWGHPGAMNLPSGDSNEVTSNLIQSPIPYFSFPGLSWRKEEASFQSWLTDSPQAYIMLTLGPAEPYFQLPVPVLCSGGWQASQIFILAFVNQGSIALGRSNKVSKLPGAKYPRWTTYQTRRNDCISITSKEALVKFSG